MIYWIPISGLAEPFADVSTHFVSKATVDWTAIIQLRHPNEVRGAQYSYSLFVTVVLDFSSAFVHGDPTIIVVMTQSCSAMFNVCFICLLSTLDQQEVR